MWAVRQCLPISCFVWPTVQNPNPWRLQWLKTEKHCKSSHYSYNHPAFLFHKLLIDYQYYCDSAAKFNHVEKSLQIELLKDWSILLMTNSSFTILKFIKKSPTNVSSDLWSGAMPTHELWAPAHRRDCRRGDAKALWFYCRHDVLRTQTWSFGPAGVLPGFSNHPQLYLLAKKS